MKTTLNDVARAAKVSLKTVDRVINGRGGVRPARERTILEHARRLGLDRALLSRPTRILRIQVLMQDPAENAYYQELHAAFVRAGKTYRPHNVVCSFNFFDVLRSEQIAELIGRVSGSADFLVIAAPNDPRIVEAIDDAADRARVITLNTDLPTSRRWKYIGADDRAAGRAAGELMGRFLGPDGGDVLLIAGLLTMRGQEEREMGFRSVTRARFPSCRVVDVAQSREQRQNMVKLVENALKKNPSIRGIYSTTSGSIPLTQTLSLLGRLEDVVIITHELTPERRALLLSGELDAVIDQNPHQQAVAVIETCLADYGRLDHAPTPAITPFSIHLRESLN